VLRPLCKETGNSITLFEEGARPARKRHSTLRRNCDEAAHVLSGEITFEIGDRSAGLAHLCRLAAWHANAWKNTGTETGRVLSLCAPAEAGGFFEEQLGRPAGSANETEANKMRCRHGDRRPTAFLAYSLS
jgi:hypothetical protein